MKIGFTGTRKGMSGLQKEQLAYILALFVRGDITRKLLMTEFHHGDCPDGADQEADEIARGFMCYRIYRYWPEKPTPKALLARDRKIAELCDVLIAAPETDRERMRSGTWATVRYARKARKPVVMLSRGK